QYQLPVALAWEVFRQKNGDPSYDRFLRRIDAYRARRGRRDDRALLSCLLLRETVFLPSDRWLPWTDAEDWSRNIVSYKTYNLGDGPGRRLAELLEATGAHRAADLQLEFVLLAGDDRAWHDQAVAVREGQGTFHLRVMAAYNWRCAVTTEHALPVLD